MSHPLGPAADHHVKTQAMVDAIRKKAARDIVRDLEQCTARSGCDAILHHMHCPVHP